MRDAQAVQSEEVEQSLPQGVFLGLLVPTFFSERFWHVAEKSGKQIPFLRTNLKKDFFKFEPI